MSVRTLWLLRHAKTVTDPPEGGSDFDRILAPRGVRDAIALSHLFGADGHGIGLEDVPLPQIALVSPAARTVATADLALAELVAPPTCHLVPAFYGADPEEVLDRLRTLPDNVSSVMVVGHNPTAQALSLGLIRRSDKKGHDLAARRGFPTCALGIYTFRVKGWADVGSHSALLTGLIIPPFKSP